MRGNRPDGFFAFVMVEAGAATLSAPLFHQWLKKEPGFPWTVLAAGPAMDVFQAQFTVDACTRHFIPVDKQEDPAPKLEGARAVIVSAAIGYRVEPLARRFAVSRNLPCATFIDTWYNFSNRFASPDEPAAQYDYLLIDDMARQRAIADGILAERITLTGHPGLEHAVRDLPAADCGDVVFLGTPVYERGIENRTGYNQDDYWAVLADCLDNHAGLVNRLWYAPHPDETWRPPTGIRQYQGILPTANALERCGTVLGAFAAPMTEAWLCGRHVIALQPAIGKPDHCMLSLNGLIPNCKDAAALANAFGDRPADISSQQQRLIKGLRNSTLRLHQYCRNLWESNYE